MEGGSIDARWRASKQRAGGDFREGQGGSIDASWRASKPRAGGDCREGKGGLIDRLHVGCSSFRFLLFELCSPQQLCHIKKKTSMQSEAREPPVRVYSCAQSAHDCPPDYALDFDFQADFFGLGACLRLGGLAKAAPNPRLQAQALLVYLGSKAA